MERKVRLARVIVADFAKTLEVVKDRYEGVDDAIIDNIGTVLPEQAIEWAVKSVSKNRGIWPEDGFRFNNAFVFFTQNKATQRYKDAVQAAYPNRKPKNLLQFTLHDMETLQERLAPKPKEEKSKRQQLREVKQKGAKVFYDKPPYKVIQIGGPGVDLEDAAQAACQYAKETRWCTSQPSTAKSYLKHNPLYVIFMGSQKVGQFDPRGGYLMNTIDMSVDIGNPKISKFMWDAGLIQLSPTLVNKFVTSLKKKLSPENEAVVAKHAQAAFTYATKVLKGRFPQGEPAISQDKEYAADYEKFVKTL